MLEVFYVIVIKLKLTESIVIICGQNIWLISLGHLRLTSDGFADFL